MYLLRLSISYSALLPPNLTYEGHSQTKPLSGRRAAQSFESRRNALDRKSGFDFAPRCMSQGLP